MVRRRSVARRVFDGQLKKARTKRDEARQLLGTDINPGVRRKAKKRGFCKNGNLGTFESVAREAAQSMK